MPTFDTGEVLEILMERPGLQRLRVRMDDGADAAEERAYCLTGLIGPVAVGDRVVCNTTAVRLGLGTGGEHVVHWNLSRRSLTSPGPDHVMKLRYTSLQVDAGTSELEHPDLPTDLGGRPVVAVSVHSQVGVVAAMLAHERPDLRVCYVMTDGAALPLVISDLIADLRVGGALAATVTAGHAFGGDLEAVTVASGMALAVHAAAADVVVVGMGPGVVGTGTALGTTAIEAASILDTAHALGGAAILCVRASSGDGRGRHRGLSHHTDTVLGLSARPPHVAPVPPELAGRPDCRTVEVDVPRPDDITAALQHCGVAVTTMGRGPREDELFFTAAAAAARVAVALHDGA